MTIPDMQRRILSDLDEARADVIRNHHDDVLYYEGYRDALEAIAYAYLNLPASIVGDHPSWQEDADAGRDWDTEGDEIAHAYLEHCATTLPHRVAALVTMAHDPRTPPQG